MSQTVPLDAEALALESVELPSPVLVLVLVLVLVDVPPVELLPLESPGAVVRGAVVPGKVVKPVDVSAPPALQARMASARAAGFRPAATSTMLAQERPRAKGFPGSMATKLQVATGIAADPVGFIVAGGWYEEFDDTHVAGVVKMHPY